MNMAEFLQEELLRLWRDALEEKKALLETEEEKVRELQHAALCARNAHCHEMGVIMGAGRAVRVVRQDKGLQADGQADPPPQQSGAQISEEAVEDLRREVAELQRREDHLKGFESLQREPQEGEYFKRAREDVGLLERRCEEVDREIETATAQRETELALLALAQETEEDNNQDPWDLDPDPDPWEASPPAVCSAPPVRAPASGAPSSTYPSKSALSSTYPARNAPSSTYPARSAPISTNPPSSAPISTYPASSAPSSTYPASSAPSSTYPARSAPASSVSLSYFPARSSPSSSFPARNAPAASGVPVSSSSDMLPVQGGAGQGQQDRAGRGRFVFKTRVWSKKPPESRSQ